MAYGHPEHWPSRDQERYRRHVQGFGELAARLLRDGHQVVLFTTDMDPPAVRDVTAAASQGLPAEARARLRAATTPTVEELFEVLAGTDLVVAARLHGVLLAHMAHRPVLAVSHERKVKTLMDGMGQERFCLDIAGFDAAQAHARLDLLASRRGEEGRAVAAAVAGFRARVEAQYDLLLGPAPSTG
jgi:polysaccharide pyruvyl transferase WcaK-like protein